MNDCKATIGIVSGFKPTQREKEIAEKWIKEPLIPYFENIVRVGFKINPNCLIKKPVNHGKSC